MRILAAPMPYSASPMGHIPMDDSSGYLPSTSSLPINPPVHSAYPLHNQPSSSYHHHHPHLPPHPNYSLQSYDTSYPTSSQNWNITPSPVYPYPQQNAANYPQQQSPYNSMPQDPTSYGHPNYSNHQPRYNPNYPNYNNGRY